VDQQIGELLAVLELERTAVWVVSDHGARRLDGGFCLNDWLIREGLLTMRAPVNDQRRFELADVDWPRTKVWGEGGYHGQIFINRAGREPQGTVPAAEYEAFRDKLAEKIEALTDHQGRPMNNRVFKPDQLYAEVGGVPPDLIVLFGDLHWRSVGAIGHSDLYIFSDDPGAEEANHALGGLYILSGPALPRGRREASIYDVAPTTLELLGLRVPRGLRGRSLL
jgi:predicted AlkP superfamily phosphohydrolase/phosphomutase